MDVEPADTAEGPLSDSDLARSASTDPARIRRYEELGLIRRVDGAFERGDVNRVRLLVALEESGIDLETLAAEVRDGRLSLGFAGEVVADSVGLTTTTHGRALSELGLDGDFARRFQLALGLPTTAATDPIRQDDLELFAIVAGALEAGLEEDFLLGAMRVFGMSVRQIVEVQRELFRRNVEERLLGEGMGYPEMLEVSAETRLKLQRLGYRTVFLLLRRFLEQAVFENLIERLEETLEEHDITRSREEPARTIAFLDLSGYTRLTEEAGDACAAEHGGLLVEIALSRCAITDGRVVKTLGDGVMLRFHEPEEAVVACLDIVARAEEAGLPPARAGIATGPVVQREADYFGRTVNLAARLVDAAGPGQVVVSESVVESAVGRVAFRSVGAPLLEGFRTPVSAFAASRAEG
ncbi:MAG: adenylate/guanylate cyclase domain-containing protein [Gemmatimonadetes bacterium]|nr:adenylate/guanylate cyclase domain-containing protein [Gemmatimonadota bacterium]